MAGLYEGLSEEKKNLVDGKIDRDLQALLENDNTDLTEVRQAFSDANRRVNMIDGQLTTKASTPSFETMPVAKLDADEATVLAKHITEQREAYATPEAIAKLQVEAARVPRNSQIRFDPIFNSDGSIGLKVSQGGRANPQANETKTINMFAHVNDVSDGATPISGLPAKAAAPNGR